MAEIHTKLLTEILQRLPNPADHHSDLFEDEFDKLAHARVDALRARGPPQGEQQEDATLRLSELEKNACIDAAVQEAIGSNCKEGKFEESQTHSEKKDGGLKPAQNGDFISFIFVCFLLNNYYFVSFNQNAF